MGYIAFFDSGIGGISVMQQAMQALPDTSFVYFADSAHVPYGPKPKARVKGFVLDAVAEMVARYPIDALVVACNTGTSIAIEDLRSIYNFPIIGMEPAVKPALHRFGQKVLVTATALTLQEQKFSELVSRLQAQERVEALALPELVLLCEQLDFRPEAIKVYLSEKTQPYKLSDFGAVVLGCTHFPYYRRVFQDFFGEGVAIIDGNEGTVNRLLQLLPAPSDPAPQPCLVWMSSRPDEDFTRFERALAYLQTQA